MFRRTCAPCWPAAGTDPPLIDPTLVYEPKYDGIRAIALDRAGEAARARAVLVAARQREDHAVSRAGRGAWRVGQRTRRPRRARRRDRRARRQRTARGLPAAAEPHPRHGPGLSIVEADSASRRTADGVHRVRSAARGRRRPARAAAHRTPRARLEALFAQAPAAVDGRFALSRASRAATAARSTRARRKKAGRDCSSRRAQSPYRDGRRSPGVAQAQDHQQDEFVVGGWTEPKGARSYFGSLILGTLRRQPADSSTPAMSAQAFSGAELERLWKLLKPLETDESPFHAKPKTLGRPHWVKPKLVAQVRYTEWTDDGRLAASGVSWVA